MKIKTRPARRGITFKVHDVTPAAEPLRECGLGEVARALINDPRPVEACGGPDGLVVADATYHPLLAAAHLAFSGHRPLSLSPDAVWLTIAQGFANHVELHAEELRECFVSHKGKLTIEVERSDFIKGSPENPWPEVFSAFGEEIRAHVGDELHALLVADFSTTGPVERAASEVVMMSAFKSYFDYVVVSICGIPEITLEGSADDWRRLRKKAASLGQYKLRWWTEHLLPICDHFVRASEGDVDLAHWRDIYKLERAYGAELINGWLAKLIPYVRRGRSGPPERRNPLLEWDPPPPPKAPPRSRLAELRAKLGRKAWDEPEPAPEAAPAVRKGITSDVLPTGLSKAPLTWKGPGDVRFPMELLGGLIGVTQDPETLALRPEAGWVVRDAERIDLAIARLREGHRLNPPLTPEQSREAGFFDRSSEMIKFFEQANGAELFPREGGSLYRLLPVEEVRGIEHAADSASESAGVSSWVKVCALADGSCYAMALADDEPSGEPARYRWDFIHTDFEKTGRYGACPIVARSFSDLLERMLAGGGERPFHEAPGFTPLGEVKLGRS